MRQNAVIDRKSQKILSSDRYDSHNCKGSHVDFNEVGKLLLILTYLPYRIGVLAQRIIFCLVLVSNDRLCRIVREAVIFLLLRSCDFIILRMVIRSRITRKVVSDCKPTKALTVFNSLLNNIQ